MNKLDPSDWPRDLLSCIGFLRGLCTLLFSIALVAPASAQLAADAQNNSTPLGNSRSARLLDKHAALSSALANNAFGRPLVIESIENSNRVTGHAYAVLNAPFAAASSVFQSPSKMCDLITLHLNTKYCRPATAQGAPLLKVNFGKKTPQDLSDTFALEFVMQTQTATPELLAVLLNAKDGPLGTSDYRIAIEAAPLPGGKTFMHLRYSYGFGVAGKIAMMGYLATAGSKKVGFTKTGQGAGAGYIGGMRGAVERNTMRYYLAIDAYLDSLSAPPAQQLNTRLNLWFDATEKYPEQFGDVDKPTYLSMKKAEYLRQQTDAR